MSAIQPSHRYFSVLNGNVITIAIANQTIGMVQSMQVQEDYGLQPVSGIGMVVPAEHSPGMARIQLTMDTIYVVSNDGKIQGTTRAPALSNVTNLDAGEIGPPTPRLILRGNVFTISVYQFDPTQGNGIPTPNGGQLIRSYLNCAYAGGSISFQKHALVMRNAQFMATDFSTEAAQDGTGGQVAAC